MLTRSANAATIARCFIAAILLALIELQHEGCANGAAAADRAASPPNVHAIDARRHVAVGLVLPDPLEEVRGELVDVTLGLEGHSRAGEAVRRLVVAVHVLRTAADRCERHLEHRD